jgi:hypothetical protein
MGTVSAVSIVCRAWQWALERCIPAQPSMTPQVINAAFSPPLSAHTHPLSLHLTHTHTLLRTVPASLSRSLSPSLSYAQNPLTHAQTTHKHAHTQTCTHTLLLSHAIRTP